MFTKLSSEFATRGKRGPGQRLNWASHRFRFRQLLTHCGFRHICHPWRGIRYDARLAFGLDLIEIAAYRRLYEMGKLARPPLW
jgi:hypothetical protein